MAEIVKHIMLGGSAEFLARPYDTEVEMLVVAHLKAPEMQDEEAGGTENRAPISVSAVIDRSGSMEGGKLELVKQTLQFVVQNLKGTDRLGVISYDDTVREELRLQAMDDSGKQNACTAVSHIVTGGSTNLSGGLFSGIDQLRGVPISSPLPRALLPMRKTVNRLSRVNDDKPALTVNATSRLFYEEPVDELQDAQRFVEITLAFIDEKAPKFFESIKAAFTPAGAPEAPTTILSPPYVWTHRWNRCQPALADVPGPSEDSNAFAVHSSLKGKEVEDEKKPKKPKGVVALKSGLAQSGPSNVERKVRVAMPVTNTKSASSLSKSTLVPKKEKDKSGEKKKKLGSKAILDLCKDPSFGEGENEPVEQGTLKMTFVFTKECGGETHTLQQFIPASPFPSTFSFSLPYTEPLPPSTTQATKEEARAMRTFLLCLSRGKLPLNPDTASTIFYMLRTSSVSSVWLFTDGLANCGIRNTEMLKREMERRLQLMSGAACSVFTFGFGVDHDANMLRTLADAANGMYYFVEKEESIATAFTDCLGGLLSVVAQNIQLEISGSNGVQVQQILTKFSNTVSPDGSGGNVFLRDIYSEEERDIVALVRLPALPHECDEPLEVLTWALTYYNVLTGQQEQTSFCVKVARPKTAAPEQPPIALDKQRNRIRCTQAMELARNLADANELERAREELERAAEDIQRSASATDAFCQGLLGVPGPNGRPQGVRFGWEQIPDELRVSPRATTKLRL
eukprot:TRINITY_DN1593_c0_g2_i2.p1 TRINITY_DN1593_c0_g2~~TRINITY_DN1593_c0_g2_i2.p1  ORF type:complete len:739 (-),score=129.96 TRINITY_DN1593_c0_g2_i2:833-3049(-)